MSDNMLYETHTITVHRPEVADFAIIMDAMLTVKEFEKEIAGQNYMQEMSNVIKEYNEQVTILTTLAKTLDKIELSNADILKLIADTQKHAVHVANYALMLFGHAQSKLHNTVKLRNKRENNKSCRPLE